MATALPLSTILIIAKNAKVANNERGYSYSFPQSKSDDLTQKNTKRKKIFSYNIWDIIFRQKMIATWPIPFVFCLTIIRIDNSDNR